MSQDQIADFKIAYDGTWFHEGAPIKREALAKLFSDRALKVDEDGNYWLQTPYEKYPVIVEDVPYVVVDYKKDEQGFCFTTNMQEEVTANADHPVVLRMCKKSGDRLPYIEIRDGLYARLSRPVYYNLIESYGPEIVSHGSRFVLGEMEDAMEDQL